MTLRVYVCSADGDRVKLNIPMALVKISMELGMDMTGSSSLKKLDVQKIVELVEKGAIVNLVEVDSALYYDKTTQITPVDFGQEFLLFGIDNCVTLYYNNCGVRHD